MADRVLKVCEEAGEAAEAYSRLVGSNPRKFSCSKEELAGELADVIATALTAIVALDLDPIEELTKQRKKTEKVFKLLGERTI
jgi:NTP pyrophosphatase (non-canonical NTP hydrolase)